jgi:hypothetical protein
MTREEVEKQFQQEGGLSTEFEQRYFLRDLPVGEKVVMVELTFQPADMPDATYADRKLARNWLDLHEPAWSARKRDLLRGISEPFVATPATD